MRISQILFRNLLGLQPLGLLRLIFVKTNNLIPDIEVPNKKFPSMSMALDDYITKANKRKRPKK